MSFKHATGTTAPTSTSVTLSGFFIKHQASEVSLIAARRQLCISVPKTAASVSFKDSLLWRGTFLWKIVHSH